MFFKKRPKEDEQLYQEIKRIIGKKPGNLSYYKLATIHTSVAKRTADGVKKSYERLEYLGDAVLSAIIAEYLYLHFPNKGEGFLTDIRSRLVNRQSLNELGLKIGLDKITKVSADKGTNTYKSLYGDVMEALIGAVYMDKGYQYCKTFVVKKLILPYFDLQEVVDKNPNFKSILLEWAHKENKKLGFQIISEEGQNHNKVFTSQVLINEEPMGIGKGLSKKKAEQIAAENTCRTLGIS